jgi:hypothetical protein
VIGGAIGGIIGGLVGSEIKEIIEKWSIERIPWINDSLKFY